MTSPKPKSGPQSLPALIEQWRAHAKQLRAAAHRETDRHNRAVVVSEAAAFETACWELERHWVRGALAQLKDEYEEVIADERR